MVWKVSGLPNALTLTPYLNFATTYFPTTSTSIGQITRMAGLEKYGFYASTKDGSNNPHLFLF